MSIGTTRITQEAVDALTTLFAEKGWKKLPHQSVLARDYPDYEAIALQYQLKRDQTQRQFVKWRTFGSPDGREAASFTDEQTRALVDQRVGADQNAYDKLVVRALNVVSCCAFLEQRPLVKPCVEAWLSLASNSKGGDEETKNLVRDFGKARIATFKSLVRENYSGHASRLRSSATKFELGIHSTRMELREEWSTYPWVQHIFGALVDNSDFRVDLKATSKEHFHYLLFDLFDRALAFEFRQCFSNAALCALSIPDLTSLPAQSPGVSAVIYYISGFELSALVTRASKNDTHKTLFTAFSACHTLNMTDAVAQNLPVSLVQSRSRGSLLYASEDFFDFVVLAEKAFSSLLTMENIIAHGARLVSRAHELVMNNELVVEAFENCMLPVLEDAASKSGIQFIDSTPLFVQLLKTYVRMRGKDFVKTLVDRLKLKQAAAVANTTRSKLAAAASAASAKRVKLSAKEDPFDNIVDEDYSEEMYSELDEVATQLDDEDGGAQGDTPVLGTSFIGDQSTPTAALDLEF
jgi:hypothetical protein